MYEDLDKYDDYDRYEFKGLLNGEPCPECYAYPCICKPPCPKCGEQPHRCFCNDEPYEEDMTPADGYAPEDNGYPSDDRPFDDPKPKKSHLRVVK